MMTIRTSRTAFAGLLGRGLADMTEIRMFIYPPALGEETAQQGQFYVTNGALGHGGVETTPDSACFSSPPLSPLLPYSVAER
jgi:hypothetical protein